MKLKAKISLVFAVCVITMAGLRAQSDVQTVDVLYTKYSTKWIGQIVEWNAETGLVRFETVSGLTMTLKIDDVLKVRQKLVRPKGERGTKPYAFREEGLYQAVELGVSAEPDAGLSVTYALGYRYSRKFGVGIGVGFENFQLGDGKRVIPVFAEARGFLSRAKISPYYVVRAGYGIALENSSYDITDARGGVLFNPQVGVRFGASEYLNFYAGFGAHFQRATFHYEWGTDERITDRFWYRRAEVKFGIIF